MQRRQFLALACATAVTGCTAQTASTEEQTTTAESTTAQPTEVATTAQATTARPTERPDTSPTRGEELIERGRTHLLAAIGEFTEDLEADDATIVDVTAATADFSRFDVNDEYESAVHHLTDAKNYTSAENTKEADELLAVAEYVNTLGFAQNHLVNAFEEVSRTKRSFYTESYGELPRRVDDLRSQRDLAAEYVDTIRESFDASTVGPVASITGEQFTAKQAQLDRELAAFDGFATQFTGLEDAMERFEDDVGNYTTKRYDGVGFNSGDFDDVVEGLAAIEAPVSLEPTLAELNCVFGALAEGTSEMRDAVFARRNDEHGDARAIEGDAETAFTSCETLVEEVRAVGDLLDSIPQ